jgi:ABC-2 type transport system ATP-binding protein
MKQRLGLARCLVHDPEVLLLDEPASGMDPRARYEMREIVKELRRLGKTVLLSSHILPELAELCTHIGIVQDGRLIREGPVDQVLGSMSAGRGVELRAFASREAVVSMLEQHPLVGAIETNVEDDGQADDADLSACTVTFRTSADDAGLRDMLRVLVEAGLGVVTFSSVRDNLEDVFMQLTDQSGDEVAN